VYPDAAARTDASTEPLTPAPPGVGRQVTVPVEFVRPIRRPVRRRSGGRPGPVRGPRSLCHAFPMQAEPPGRDDMVEHRFYGDLAPWWPLISPVAEYESESAYIATLLHSSARPVVRVLDLGSGGGHVAAHLKRHFDVSLVDLSPRMLEVSRRLNPECPHVVADMRTVRLDTSFDAVLVHDAIDYMTTPDDLAAAVRTAFAHCSPGGMAIFLPDAVAETFAPGSDTGGSDGDDGRAVRFLEWTWDPDPADTWVLTQYVFVLRGPDDVVEVVPDLHRTGLFRRDVWLAVLAEAGFEASATEEDTDEDRAPRTVFVGHRPRA
jgi:SAM-dependent methyltransferase